MKKKILLFTFLTATLIAAATEGPDVDPQLQEKFEAKFGKTTPVKWKKIQHMYIGQFTSNFQSMDCYFTEEGELLGTGKYFSSDKIDDRTRAMINQSFRHWHIQLAYEYTFANELPQQMFVLSNVKFTAIIRVNLFGSLEVIEKKKNNLFKDSPKFDLSKVNDLKTELFK
jgi:hypothetical protein